MELIEKLPEIKKRLNPKSVSNIYKHILAIREGYVETFEAMEKYQVYPTLPCEFMSYTVEPRSAIQTLDLAEKMNFLENIKRNPNLLSVPVSEIIKRMGQCDAVAIPYRDEKTNLCAGFIFSAKEFNEKVVPLLNKEGVVVEKEAPTIENLDSGTDKVKIKEHAKKLLEIFTLTSKEDEQTVMNIIDKIDASALSEKEILVSAFKEAFQVGNVELLNTEIDHVLEMDKEKGNARVLQMNSTDTEAA